MTILDAYVNKTVPFKFNGAEIRLDLSHALFSSFEIDAGTRLLLKTTARDPVLASARKVLDEGCGVGVIGLCVAKAFPEAEVLLRDRDGLAVAFAERNRLANKLRGIAAWTDPGTGSVRVARPAPLVEQGLMGDGREGGPFDFVFSNLPAKAGAPVLAEFFDRLGAERGPPLLIPGGRAGIVIVNPLAEAAARWIAEAGLIVVASEHGSMHRVYIVERRADGAGDSFGTLLPISAVQEPASAPPLAYEEKPGETAKSGQEAPSLSAFPGTYYRGEARFKLAGLAYRATGFWGLPEFDTPGFGSCVAAELALRVCSLPAPGAATVHDALFIDPGVGHVALWASRVLGIRRVRALSRDRLSLLATGMNLSSLPERYRPDYAALDTLSADDLPSASFDLVVDSPDIVPERDWIGPSWSLATRVLRQGGIYLAFCSPTEMTRLERRRPSARSTSELSSGDENGRARWSLLGRKRKKGSVAAAWRRG